MKNTQHKHKVLIGLRPDGSKFRPSDWAERMCGTLSTFRNRRIYYSPLLRPAVRDGIKCVIVDSGLVDQHPEIHQQVIQFAETNGLQVLDEE
jgi:hypothetical protein